MRKKIERVKEVKKIAAPVKADEKKKEKPKLPSNVKTFSRWESNIEIKDPGLKAYISLEPRIIPRTAGRLRRPFHKSRAHIAERLAQHLMVPGHQGRKHKITSGHLGGSLYNALKIVEKTFEIIENEEKKNPLEVLVRAIENSAIREEIISYQMGSIIAREAVITSPQRRIDKSLRLFAQGAYRKCFGKKISIEQALANEILATYHGKESFAMQEKERIEREAAGAR